jgi:DNA-binding MarR family transcriptional regulator
MDGMSKLKAASSRTSAGVIMQPQGCTNFKLRQLMRRVGQHYDLEMARIGLKTTQYSLLSYVLKLGPVRPGDLAKAMTMDASTLTRNLKPLIAAGWVELASGPDGRSRSVSITPAGRDKRTEAQRRWKVAQQSINALLGVERVLALHALVDDSLGLLAPVSVEPVEPVGENL